MHNCLTRISQTCDFQSLSRSPFRSSRLCSFSMWPSLWRQSCVCHETNIETDCDVSVVLVQLSHCLLDEFIFAKQNRHKGSSNSAVNVSSSLPLKMLTSIHKVLCIRPHDLFFAESAKVLLAAFMTGTLVDATGRALQVRDYDTNSQ